MPTPTALLARMVKRSPSRWSLGAVGLAIALGVALTGGYVATRLLLDVGRTRTVDRSSPVVLAALADLANYQAASGSFQVVVDQEHDVSRVPSLIAGERTILVAAGSVDAAVDFSELAADKVTVSADRASVEIVLPHATLGAAKLDNANTAVVARQRGLVERVSDALVSNPVDDSGLLRLAETKLQEAAARTELTTRAEDNTRLMLTALLQSLGFTDVVVRFEKPTTP